MELQQSYGMSFLKEMVCRALHICIVQINLEKGCTVDSRYLEVEGTLWNTSRYPYFDISDFKIEENTNRTTEFHKWIRNKTPLVRNI